MAYQAADQLRALIDNGTEPDLPRVRLVLQLTARIPDPIVQGDLNEQLNATLKQLELDRALLQEQSSTRDEAHAILARVIAAGRH